jgi:glutathione-regulated potassium-efflux system ancillary protein KefC/glutathione-regulated potassium-efflux system protein KefB
MLANLALFLAAAVVAVPIFRRLGLGAVLGYLAAGMLIGPSGFGWIPDYESVLELSSFGVVLMMFVIGLELQPVRLWRLRATVFGLGGAQVAVTTAVLALLASGFGLRWQPALIVGFGLAMSSTAFVLQMLSERRELSTHHGRAAFGILLFQDLSVIPAVALLPMLAGAPAAGAGAAVHGMAALRALLAVAAVVAGGRYLLRPLLRVIAWMRMPELFTAAALLVVTATALLMQAVGLSMSLGAFLAGVLLADSEYRHELEADIEPFKGLLLGLFFIAVGMSADLDLLRQEPQRLLALVAGLVAIKAVILYVAGRLRGLDAESSRSLGVALSQGGEFAFVLFGIAGGAGLIDTALRDELIVAVTLSMIVTPPLYALQARLRKPVEAPPFDEISVAPNDVIIAGFGTFGQIFARMLRVKKYPFTVLEKNWQHVDFVRRFGNKIFYSDASRIEVLRAAGADRARFFVLAIANPEESLRVAEVVRNSFPHLRVFAAASDRRHAMQLMDLGIKDVIRRSYGSSLELTAALLRALGEPEDRVERDLRRFRKHDHETLLRQFAVYRDEQKLIQSSLESAQELQQLFESDVEQAAADPGR